MSSDRRLTIFFMGLVTLAALVGIVVLSYNDRPVPDLLGAIAIGGLGVLAPSPLSKTTTARDV